ncbi:MAG: diphosphatase [Solirubrobacteraceae bacterium]|nr:diphosphatase [Solirubrobacteraceae bacterium]
MPPTNTFAGAAIDRVANRRTDRAWFEEQLRSPAARAIVVSREGPFVDCSTDPCRPALVALAELREPREPVLLGIDAEGPLFAVDGEGDIPALSGARTAMSLRDAGARVSQEHGGLLAYATAIVIWHRNHPFCARCGHGTDIAEAGHVRHCPNCGAVHHPRTDPVVIMLVADGDRVLLGRNARWPKGRYSTLAGFVEPGESLEEAVAREVCEEAGVTVTDIRFRSSQPWPFPASLMVGFHSRYAGGEAEVRDAELEDVRWFTRDEIAAAIRGQTDIHLPPPVAIARRLIDEWLEA